MTILNPQKNRILSSIVALMTLSSCSSSETSEEWIELDLPDHTYFEADSKFKQAQYEILIPKQSWIEYKITMQQGDSIIYSWTSNTKNPDKLSVEFHGHTEKKEDEPGTVMFYKIHNAGKENGTLIAPFDGVQGWYLNNETDEDIIIELSIVGTFEEVEEEQEVENNEEAEES